MHPFWLKIIFLCLYFVGAILAGLFGFRPLLGQASARQVRDFVGICLLLITLACIAQYFGLRYLNDGEPPSFRQQVLPLSFFLTTLVTLVFQWRRLRGRQLS